MNRNSFFDCWYSLWSDKVAYKGFKIMILVHDYDNGQIKHRDECRTIDHNSEPWLMIVCNNFCHWNHFPILILTVHVNFRFWFDFFLIWLFSNVIWKNDSWFFLWDLFLSLCNWCDYLKEFVRCLGYQYSSLIDIWKVRTVTGRYDPATDRYGWWQTHCLMHQVMQFRIKGNKNELLDSLVTLILII